MNPQKYIVVTTFNQEGYKQYGSRMLDTFLQSWPKTVAIKAYSEQGPVTQSAPNLEVLDLEQASTALVKFKQQWQHVPKANGNPFPGAERKAYKWQAVRFAHKVYAIFHAAQTYQSEWLIWMDADMVCHSAISPEKLTEFFPDDHDICFAGRSNKFTECGLYGLHLTQPMVQQFLQEFQRMYDQAELGIFTLPEWHDSYVFDAVRAKFALRELNWSKNLINGEGHPLINCEWGAYIDHLKGKRKQIGRSKAKDLLQPRREAYWR